VIKVDSSSASRKFSSGSYDAQVSIDRYFDSLNSTEVDFLIVGCFTLQFRGHAVDYGYKIRTLMENDDY
jgi:hypothetical protein